MIGTMSNATNYNFISNSVKGIQACKKRLKLFEYLKQNVNFNGFILFQETHSYQMMKNNGKMGLMVLFFSHTAKQILAVLQLDFAEKILSI